MHSSQKDFGCRLPRYLPSDLSDVHHLDHQRTKPLFWGHDAKLPSVASNADMHLFQKRFHAGGIAGGVWQDADADCVLV